MTTLARRTLLQFSRHTGRQTPRLFRPNLTAQTRNITVSQRRPQTPTPQESIETEDFAGLNDAPVFIEDDTTQVDWSRSFHGLSTQPFSEEAAKILNAPLAVDDVEMKPGTSSS